MNKYNTRVTILFNGEFYSVQDMLSNYTIENLYQVQVGIGGQANDLRIQAGGSLIGLGGIIDNVTAMSGSAISVESGTISRATVLKGATLELAGLAEETTSLGGNMTLQNGSEARVLSVTGAGMVNMLAGASLTDAIFYTGSLSIDGAKASHVELWQGEAVLMSSAIMEDLWLADYTAKLTLQDGAQVLGLTMDGASATAENGATIANSELWTIFDVAGESGTEEPHGSTLVLKDGASHKGTLSIDAKSLLIAEDGAIIDFTLLDAHTGAAALLNDLSRISGTPDFTMTVSEEQTAGTYALAGKATAFEAPVTLYCEEFGTMTMSVGETAVYHNSVYALALNGDTLSATVTDFEQFGSADALAWDDINGAESYMLELGNVQLEVSSLGVDLLGLANGDYAWRVRNAAESDNWQTGESFSQTATPEEPQKLAAVTNDATDLFFANVDGVWGNGYVAKHVGNGSWAGTGETVNLAGKARITDIFAGSEDASILVCSVPEMQTSGIALFLDDIYSAAAGTPEQARLSQINTILATEGADIIDLTSQRFELAGGVTVHGNGGDDVIWANSGENTLFGGEGDDRIIGGSGNDILIGGAGNDTLHGGGGSDIFCFDEAWGQDSISQLPNGAVTLWFSQSNDILQLTFTADGNDTLITASTGDTIRTMGMSLSLDDCRFGAAGYETEYNLLASAGVFA